jgi:hypothetical protein
LWPDGYPCPRSALAGADEVVGRAPRCLPGAIDVDFDARIERGANFRTCSNLVDMPPDLDLRRQIDDLTTFGTCALLHRSGFARTAAVVVVPNDFITGEMARVQRATPTSLENRPQETQSSPDIRPIARERVGCAAIAI